MGFQLVPSDLFLAILESISLPVLNQRNVTLTVKRDDQLHPIVSGNKAFKLKYNIVAALNAQADTLLTFGGAYSNHLHAAAYAAYKKGLNSVGVIRGEQILPLNPTLRDCVKWGMTLHPVSRKHYQEKNSEWFQEQLRKQYPNAFFAPEGGANKLGVKGAEEILAGILMDDFDYVIAACGTGTTLAGLIRASKGKAKVIGIPVLKNAHWMFDEIQQWLPSSDMQRQGQWELWLDYHFGGYAKKTDDVIQFRKAIFEQISLPLDDVYTAKAFYAVLDQIEKGYFKAGSRILFCHTGGLQGMRDQ